jgi:rhamnosyl/mannosyltransferase
MPLALSRLKADVFHLQFPSPPGEVSWLTARPRGAMVVSYQSDIVRQKAILPLYGPVVRAVLDRARVIMASTDRYIEQSAFLRPHRDKCQVVPLGIALEAFADLGRHQAAADALRALYGGPLVLFVGRLRAYKGLHVLLEAMTRVRGRLVIVGDGPEREDLHAASARLGLADRVHFAGDVTDDGLLAHLAAADVGVLPSILPSEAYGMAMVEMLACGVPVVCTELGTGTSFVNQHERTGFVVPPNDPRALAAALNQLLDDRALRARMGAAGREHAQRHLSIEAMLRGVDRAYATALEGR